MAGETLNPNNGSRKENTEDLSMTPRPGGAIERLRDYFDLVYLPPDQSASLDEDNILAPLNADSKSLATLSLSGRVEQLLEVATIRVRNLHDDRELAKKVALDRLYEILSANPRDASETLFAFVQPRDSNTLTYIGVLEDLYARMQRDIAHMRIEGAAPHEYLGRFREVMVPFADAAEHARQRFNAEDGIFLVEQSMQEFLFHVSHLDNDVRNLGNKQAPFEIFSGQYAALSSDEDRLYIAPKGVSGLVSDDVSREKLRALILEEGMPIDAKAVGLNTGIGLDAFVRMFRPETRAAIRHSFGIEAQKLTLREQFYLFSFLCTVRSSMSDYVHKFIDDFGIDGARTFLAGAVDSKVGDEILAFARDAKKEDVEKVFAAFGELADEVDKLQSYLEKEFGIAESVTIQAIAEKLLLRGRDLLGQANKYKNNPAKLKELLQQRSAKGQLLLSVYRVLKDQKQIKTLADLEGVRYETVKGKDVEEGKQAAYEALYRKNHPEEAGGGLVTRFREELSKDEAELQEISYQGRLIAFMLIVPTGEKKVHASALNVDREFVGAQVGPKLLGKLLDLARSGTTVEIEALPRLAEQYSKQYGFVKTSEFIDPADNELTFKLELRPLS